MSQSQVKKSDPDSIATTNLTRRQAMRGLVGGAAAVGAGSIGLRTSSQEVDAIAPVVYGAGVAGSITVGWLVMEYGPLLDDSPPEGLSPEAFAQSTKETVMARESNNASTFIDNQNILDGAGNAAYTDGKIAAIEKLNEEATQEEVTDAATEAVYDYEQTVKENLVKSWNESVREFEKIGQEALEIGSWESREYFEHMFEHDSSHDDYHGWPKGETTEDTITITDRGDTHPILSIDCRKYDYLNSSWANSYTFHFKSHADEFGLDTGKLRYLQPESSDDPFNYLVVDEWEALYDSISDEFVSVRDGLTTWVDTLYSDVQSGSIEIQELITPRERAEMMSDDEDIAPAIADLIALNASVDPEREATITLVDDDVTLRGTFARTADPDGEPLESGETYDPETLTGDIYFSYDVSQGQGIWSDYETGVDGGTVTFTAEPFESVEFLIETTAGETATVASSEFADNGDGTYSVDISGQVEDSITEIESVEMFPEDSETQFETVHLNQSFTIDKFEDTDGNEVESASFDTSSEPQTDDNYITQEEWDEMQERNEELIEKYEEAQSGGGGLFGGGGILEGTNSTILIVVAAGLAAVGLLNN